MFFITSDYRDYIAKKYKFKKLIINDWELYDNYILKLRDYDVLLSTHLYLSQNNILIKVFDTENLNHIEIELNKLIRKEKIKNIL